jgi:YggT family protein
MFIISRTFWFVYWAILGIIVGVIVLMVLRLIADAMDLNPFAWISRTLRRLTDGFIIPVRGALRGFGADPKFAPLVVILIAIVLGYFVLQLVGTIGGTLVGVLQSMQVGAVITALGFLLYGLLSIYTLLIIIRIIFMWAAISYTNRLMRFLVDVTEPLLGPLRRMIPPLGWLDISPIVAFFILLLLQAAVAGTLLRGASFQTF